MATSQMTSHPTNMQWFFILALCKNTIVLSSLAFRVSNPTNLYTSSHLISFAGVEKKNDLAKKDYFKNSKRWDSSADILRHDYQLWLQKIEKERSETMDLYILVFS